MFGKVSVICQHPSSRQWASTTSHNYMSSVEWCQIKFEIRVFSSMNKKRTHGLNWYSTSPSAYRLHSSIPTNHHHSTSSVAVWTMVTQAASGNWLSSKEVTHNVHYTKKGQQYRKRVVLRYSSPKNRISLYRLEERKKLSTTMMYRHWKWCNGMDFDVWSRFS